MVFHCNYRHSLLLISIMKLLFYFCVEKNKSLDYGGILVFLINSLAIKKIVKIC